MMTWTPVTFMDSTLVVATMWMFYVRVHVLACAITLTKSSMRLRVI